MTTIGFIGAGNMATSLIGGLIAAGFSSKRIWASNIEKEKLENLKKEFQIHVTENNTEVAQQADVILICVKPKHVADVCEELKPLLKKQLIISIAAGISIASLQQWCGKSLPFVRAMPNTPALVRAGITGLFATNEVSDTQHKSAESILRAVGSILWVKKEDDLNSITALSGSGPAYFLLFMEALRDAGVSLGLTFDDAQLLVSQTALGTAKLAMESNEEWSTLRKHITSPGGTTEQAIHTFVPDLITLCEKAVKAAYARSIELAKG